MKHLAAELSEAAAGIATEIEEGAYGSVEALLASGERKPASGSVNTTGELCLVAAGSVARALGRLWLSQAGHGSL